MRIVCIHVKLICLHVSHVCISQAVAIYKAEFQEVPSDFTADVRYGRTYIYPQWAYILGWFIAGGPIVVGLLFGAMHAIAAAGGSGCEVSYHGYHFIHFKYWQGSMIHYI